MAVEQTDAQLVSRCREGDVDAWNEFVERFSRYVYAICSRGFRLAEHDAEDVFQEVFARAFERLSELRSDDAVRPWLAQLTRRLCIDRLRLLARDTPSDTEPDEREVDDVLATLGLRHVADHQLHGLVHHTVDLFRQRLGIRDGQLVALAAHVLDDDRELQLAAADDAEGVGALGRHE